MSKLEIKRGSTRIVFLIGNWAIKIPNFAEWRLFLHGLLGNMQEKRFSIYPEICPIIFSIRGGFMNIAKRARELSEEEFEREILGKCKCTQTSVIFIDENYRKLRIEKKASSFGWLDGKIVIIDYGD